ncbi:MAG: hypothetical protein HDT21_12350 [Ruminococcus sp.]|nr:hypothetical protein [Ruminococcus sp.]
MSKIKKSFTRVLPFVFIFVIVLKVADNIADRLPIMIAANFGGLQQNSVNITVFFKLALTAAVSPLYIGFYNFCFERVRGKYRRILTVFDFYRSAGKIFKSLIAGRLGAIAERIFYILMALIFRNVPIGNGGIAVFIVCSIGMMVISIFFLCMPYLYARNEDIGMVAALKLSFKLGLKYLLVFMAVGIAVAFPEILYTVSAFTVQPEEMIFTKYLLLIGADLDIARTLMYIIVNTLSIWASFTAVYIIFERERDNMLKDFFNKFKKDIDTSDESIEDAPFIEPYDFCIEADERFSDEKIIETENIRGVDILAALEEMDLAFDVVNHFGIRRKLKKMFDDLAFEIGEFVTYEGGRSIENFFTEEIDEREFEVSVEISKASDYEPFKLILRVDISEEE